jgi:glycosyltransferase involved in cell wall biosynthesis
MHPFFSIIIPTLNEEAFLPMLLDALVDQTYTDFEVIIADGSSSDGTIKIARRYMKKLSLSITTAEKANVSLQRNLGAKKAKGQYLVFFDADALVPSLFLERIAQYLYSTGTRLLTTYMRSPDGDVRKQLITTIVNVSITVANFIRKPVVGGYNITVDRELFFAVGGFNPELTLSEDHDFVRRCLAYGKKMKILSYPKQTLSFRRFEQYGFWQTMQLYTVASMHVLLKGPSHNPHIQYPMGGHMYKKEHALYFDEYSEV